MDYVILVPVLTFFTVIGIGGSFLAQKVARRRPIRDRLQGLGMDGEPDAPKKTSMSADAMALVGKSVSGKGPSRTLQEDLLQAGYHDPSAPAIFLGLKVTLLFVGLGIGAILFNLIPGQLSLRIILLIAFAFFLSLIPNIVVNARKQERRREVRLHLPDAIDLLEICVSSGMGLDMAWNAVAAEVRGVSPILADEMALANLEIHLGADRATALRHMARRTGAEELSSLVATLIQSEKFGTSIADALRVFAESMRIERSQKAEEAAEKMAVKLIVPMVLFIFPAMLIVCAGSAFIQIYKVILGGG